MSGSPEERFEAVVDELVERPGVTPPTPGTGFGSNGLKVDDKIFAMLVRGRLVVKLPRQRVDALADGGEGERFDPGSGRLMKEWLILAPDSEQNWLDLALEALQYVGSTR
ncbi:hypothetical protein ACFFHJ_31460 [Planotetraspora thailandica]|uniref:hypothetical protein n=1 Tax=Planotetraspora thailandica TaxID=487172 RepID=UPI00194F0F94|nr:hypothetical protein [Planotetraspora thailandica]